VVTTVVDVLRTEHQIIGGLFEDYDASRDPDVALRLGNALVLHALIEDSFLYPLVRRLVPGGSRHADEAEDDHEKVKAFVAEAEDTIGPALDELVAELRDDVDIHMRWEEDDLFPVLLAVIDPVVLTDTAGRILDFKRHQPVA
jgi:hypothetical protein